MRPTAMELVSTASAQLHGRTDVLEILRSAGIEETAYSGRTVCCGVCAGATLGRAQVDSAKRARDILPAY